MKDGTIFEANVTAEAIAKLESFEMREGDVLIAAYPKTGEFKIDDTQQTDGMFDWGIICFVLRHV
jgi:hypothetical protein